MRFLGTKLHQICEWFVQTGWDRPSSFVQTPKFWCSKQARREGSLSIATVGLVVAAVWISLLILVVAMCRAAARADAHSDKFFAASL